MCIYLTILYIISFYIWHFLPFSKYSLKLLFIISTFGSFISLIPYYGAYTD